MRVPMLALLVLLGGCASLPGDVSELERTWLGAKAYLPNETAVSTPAAITLTKPLPVVLYFHGCTGLVRHDERWGEEIRRAGFIAILPDSFARRDRKQNCDPNTRQTGYFLRALPMRDEEIRYAVERVRAMPWADTKNIFVMGHSEGGRAAMTNVVSNVRGTIVSGWNCTARRSDFQGIPHPRAHPTMILEWERDPWHAGGGSCQIYLSGRSNTTYVKLVGEGHNTVGQTEARRAVRAFLGEQVLR